MSRKKRCHQGRLSLREASCLKVTMLCLCRGGCRHQGSAYGERNCGEGIVKRVCRDCNWQRVAADKR